MKQTFYEKVSWLMENVDYNTLIEWALNDPIVIDCMYEHFTFLSDLFSDDEEDE